MSPELQAAVATIIGVCALAIVGITVFAVWKTRNSRCDNHKPKPHAH